MDKFANMLGEKVGRGCSAESEDSEYSRCSGDMVEDAVKNALGAGDKDEAKDKKKGGFFSKIFNKDDDKKKEKAKDKDKGGIFSFGDDKKKEEEKGGFFSKIFDKDDDDKGKDKKSGFAGLFVEQEGASAAGGNEGETEGGSEEDGGIKGQSLELNDGDLLSDLMDVAEETSKGQ